MLSEVIPFQWRLWWTEWGVNGALRGLSFLWALPSGSWFVLGVGSLMGLIVGSRLWRIGLDESSIGVWPIRGVGCVLLGLGWGVLATLALGFLWVTLVQMIERGVLDGVAYLRAAVTLFWPDHLWWWLLGAGVGVIAGWVCRWWLIGRVLEPWLNGVLAQQTRRRSRDRLSDIRGMDHLLPAVDAMVDPRVYFGAERFFVGLDERDEPVTFSRSLWCGSHTQVKGATRTGKGVVTGVLAAQGLAQGDAVVVLDPKGDKWLPHVVRAASEAAGVGFHVLDLRPTTPPQFNILSGVTTPELELLLDAGLGFEETGAKGADYYAKVDRRTLRQSVQLVAGEDLSLPEMLARVHAEWPQLEKAQSGFLLALEEVADLSCLHTREGLDLEAALRAGDAIYVIGDMLNTRVVKLQKMVLLRLLQLVNRRDDSEGHRHVTLYLDEFKYCLSRIALNALGTILHKGCNVVLSHQTDGDLRACPGLDPEEVIAVVQSNAQIRLFYRQDLPDDAARAAAMSGLKVIDKERRTVGRNAELAEVVEPERLVDEVQTPLYDTNIMQSLPPRCAVVFAPGARAQLAITSPYVCTRLPLALTAATPLAAEATYSLVPEALI